MAWQSLNALLEAQKLSSGELWLTLYTFNHPELEAPLRFVSPYHTPFMSRGETYSASLRLDAKVGSDRFDEPARAMVRIEGTDGMILAALQALREAPTISIEIVIESEPDIVQWAALDFEAFSLRQEGLTSIELELGATRYLSLPFPGINMDRQHVPGIYLDT